MSEIKTIMSGVLNSDNKETSNEAIVITKSKDQVYNDAPDHMRDCECMMLACAIISGVLDIDVGSISFDLREGNENL